MLRARLLCVCTWVRPGRRRSHCAGRLIHQGWRAAAHAQPRCIRCAWASSCQVETSILHTQNSTTACAAAAGIRLAGATHDVHIFDVRSGKWEKITPQGEPPSPRAAHAAAAVGNMVVIQVRTFSNGSCKCACNGLTHVSPCAYRVVSGLQAWPQRICMCWTSPTRSALAGTGAVVQVQHCGAC